MLPVTNARRRQRGFTLLELMVSVGIMGALGGVIVTSSFAMLKAQNDTNAQAEVAIEISKSTRWIVRDIHRAASSDLADAAPAANTAGFTWNEAGVITTCTYSLNGGNDRLERTCPSGTLAVTNGVTGLQFTRAGDLVTVSYTITSTRDASYTEDVTLNVLLGGG